MEVREDASDQRAWFWNGLKGPPGRVAVASDWDLLRVRSGAKGRRSATGVVDRMS